MEAAQPFLPPVQPIDPTAPGPFAFADPERVEAILRAAGFEDVRLTPFDAMIGGGAIGDMLDLTFRVGPLGAALREAPHLAPVVRQAVRACLSDHDTPQGVLMPAAVWIVVAARTR